MPDAAGHVSWGELLQETSSRLADGPSESPDVDARRLIEAAAGVEPRELHGALVEFATTRGVARLDAMVGRRLDGEPLQYVVGCWGFRQLDLMVDHRVLIPRPETEVVAGLAIDEVAARSVDSDRSVVVADLGTGSGAIALSVAVECPCAQVFATDRSSDALAVARANLAGIGRAASRVSILEGSWFDALPASARGSLDVVVSNPPYIADGEGLPSVVADYEPSGALRAGPSGREDLEHLVEEAEHWVAPGGAIVLEMAPDQTSGIAALYVELGWIATVHQDLAGRPRAVVARRH